MNKCKQCVICGSPEGVELVCTATVSMLNQADEQCWCVCERCSEKYISQVEEFYRPIQEGADPSFTGPDRPPLEVKFHRPGL